MKQDHSPCSAESAAVPQAAGPAGVEPSAVLIEAAARALHDVECGGPLGFFANGSPMRSSAFEDHLPVQQELWRNMARAVLTLSSETPTPDETEPQATVARIPENDPKPSAPEGADHG